MKELLRPSARRGQALVVGTHYAYEMMVQNYTGVNRGRSEFSWWKGVSDHAEN